MKILGVIPSRYASTRFPGKPLVLINGKSMISRVYEQALKSTSLLKVIVATDDERIFQHVQSFGGNVLMTSADHASGTDRCAEVLGKTKEQWDAIVNIQGDEPFIDPLQIDLVAQCLNTGAEIATLIKKITGTRELINPNIPKVVISKSNKALYFSRQPIPFRKGLQIEQWCEKGTYYKHIGIYGYQASVLTELAKLPQGELESAESLEQLRWLERGYSIITALTDLETLAVDTPDDLTGIPPDL